MDRWRVTISATLNVRTTSARWALRGARAVGFVALMGLALGSCDDASPYHGGAVEGGAIGSLGGTTAIGAAGGMTTATGGDGGRRDGRAGAGGDDGDGGRSGAGGAGGATIHGTGGAGGATAIGGTGGGIATGGAGGAIAAASGGARATGGSGGATQTGGVQGTGGGAGRSSGTGGSTGTGGAHGTGGSTGSGGTRPTGGAPGAGGSAGVGGDRGGRSGGSGGAANSGGQGGLGGTVGTGGAAGGGGGGDGGAGGSPQLVTVRATDFADYQVIQRAIGGTSQVVVVRGSYTGAVASIQAQVVDFATGANVVVAWTTIAPTVSGGAFSGSLTVPQGGWYKIAVRALGTTNVELARDVGKARWGVGINILCIGQSNMVGNGGLSNYTVVPSDLAALRSNDQVWKHLSDPYDGGGQPSDIDYDSWIGVSMVPSLVNALAAQYPTIPIGVVPAARGSTPLHGTDNLSWITRNPANHADTSNLYGNSVAKARAAGGVELIVMHQGETDATNMTSQAAYQADLKSLLGYYREDLYPAIPLFICQLGRSTSSISEKNRTDATLQPIRSAQLLSDDGANIYLAATAIDVDIDGTDHYAKASHDTLGPRIANAIKYHYGVATYYRGPAIVSAAYTDEGKASIDVRLSHRGGADFTPTSGINGFQVLDDGVAVTLGAVVRKDASTITIALPSAIVGTATVRYLYGKLPTNSLTGAIHDDTPLHLPLEPTARDIVLP